MKDCYNSSIGEGKSLWKGDLACYWPRRGKDFHINCGGNNI